MDQQAGEIPEVPKTEFDFALTRRRLLGLGVAAAAVIGLAPMPAMARASLARKRVLSFRNAHSEEAVTVVYWANGRYVPNGLKQISRLMRDRRTNQVKLIDPRLLDQLYDLKMRLSPKSHYEVFSGYRSPASNARLRRVSRGVAKNSFHMRGQAVDVKLSGVAPSTLARAARKMECGGVGYYRRFVHLDTGDVRTWRG
jgi:uncharacterized protein YcbK (DUF882 family)